MARFDDTLLRDRMNGPLTLIETSTTAKRMDEAPATMRTVALYRILEGLVGACHSAIEGFDPLENIEDDDAQQLFERLRKEANKAGVEL